MDAAPLTGPEAAREWARRWAPRNLVAAALAAAVLLLWATGRWREPRGRRNILEPSAVPDGIPSFDTVYVRFPTATAIVIRRGTTFPLRAAAGVNSTLVGPALGPTTRHPPLGRLSADSVATLISAAPGPPPPGWAAAHTGLQLDAAGAWGFTAADHGRFPAAGRLVVRPGPGAGVAVGWLPRPRLFPSAAAEERYRRWAAAQAGLQPAAGTGAGAELAVVPAVLVAGDGREPRGWDSCGAGEWALAAGVIVSISGDVVRVARCAAGAAAPVVTSAPAPALLSFERNGVAVTPLVAA